MGEKFFQSLEKMGGFFQPLENFFPIIGKRGFPEELADWAKSRWVLRWLRTVVRYAFLVEPMLARGRNRGLRGGGESGYIGSVVQVGGRKGFSPRFGGALVVGRKRVPDGLQKADGESR